METIEQQCSVWSQRVMLSDSLRARGLRPTHARVGVLNLLREQTAGLGAEEIFRALLSGGGRAAMGTVYRVLHELEQGRLIERETHPGPPAKSCYRLAPATPPPASYRFTCRICRQQIAIADPQWCQQLHRHAREAGFDRQLADLRIDMTCNACAAP